MLHQTIGNPVNSRKQAMLLLFTVGLFNIAMENNLCLDDLPMNNEGFSEDFPWQIPAPPLLSHQRSGQSPDVERMKATDAPVGFGEKMIYLYINIVIFSPRRFSSWKFWDLGGCIENFRPSKSFYL